MADFPVDFYKDERVQIIHGDSRMLSPSMLPQVDFVMTSPPYNAGKDYEDHDDDLKIEDFLALIEAVARKTFLMARPGAFAVWNVPFWIGSRPKLFAPEIIRQAVLDAGWLFTDWISWIKGAPEGEQASSTAWGNFPTTPSIRNASEPLLVFKKEGVNTREITDVTWAEWARFTLGVWNIRSETNQKDHPAKWPLALPLRALKIFSAKGEIVFDPFCGSGTLLAAAMMLGRRGLGCDISSVYCEQAKAKCRQGTLGLDFTARR